MDSSEHFEALMQLADGTPASTRFLSRVAASGFSVQQREVPVTFAEFDEQFFTYDPARFRLFDLFHEKQHLIVYEKAKKLLIPLRKLFNAKMRSVCETDAYLAEISLCQRYDFPERFVEERKELLLEYIWKARTALQNKDELRELAKAVFSYDIQVEIELYLQ